MFLSRFRGSLPWEKIEKEYNKRLRNCHMFVPELFVLVRKRLDHDFFNMLTLMLAEAEGSKPKKKNIDADGNDHGGYNED